MVRAERMKNQTLHSIISLTESCPALDLLEHKGVKSISKRLNRYNCHPYPGLVFECVANEMIINCPAERFHNTAQCKVSRDYLVACMDYLKYKQ